MSDNLGHHHTGLIGLILISVMALIVIFAVWSVVDSRIIERTTTVGNETITYNSSELFFSEEVWSKINSSSLEEGLLTASGVILGLTFVVSQIVISHISEKYSPIVLKHYSTDPRTTRVFLSLIFITVAATILLFIGGLLPPSIIFLLTAGIMFSFVVALILFVSYFYSMFIMLDPRALLQDIVARAIKSGKAEPSLMQQLADVGVKAIASEDIYLTREALRQLHIFTLNQLQLGENDNER